MSSSRGGATIGNTSFLGTYLLFNTFFAIFLFFTKKTKEGKIEDWVIKIGYLVATIALFLPVYVGEARAAALSIAGGLALLIILYLAFGIKWKKVQIFGKVLLVVAAKR